MLTAVLGESCQVGAAPGCRLCPNLRQTGSFTLSAEIDSQGSFVKIRIQGFSEASSSENNGDAFIYREKSGVSPLKIDASLLLLLGLPELGMTRAEILTHNSEMLTLFGSSTEMLFQLLFAYMAAMYLAGSQLTKG